jgi:hypothetical protein
MPALEKVEPVVDYQNFASDHTKDFPVREVAVLRYRRKLVRGMDKEVIYPLQAVPVLFVLVAVLGVVVPAVVVPVLWVV